MITKRFSRTKSVMASGGTVGKRLGFKPLLAAVGLGEPGRRGTVRTAPLLTRQRKSRFSRPVAVRVLPGNGLVVDPACRHTSGSNVID